jgi:predicted lipid-binding transport protein (Tim44 family)
MVRDVPDAGAAVSAVETAAAGRKAGARQTSDEEASMINEQAMAHLRELENHLMAMKVLVRSGRIPLAMVDTAQEMVADILRAFGEAPEPIGAPLADREVVDAIQEMLDDAEVKH